MIRNCMTPISAKQKLVFQILENIGELILACGPKGISVNLCGRFAVRKNHLGDDQLDCGDGTQHLHIEWSRVKSFELGDFNGEGMITFFDGNETLFKFYHPAGPLPATLSDMSKDLTD